MSEFERYAGSFTFTFMFTFTFTLVVRRLFVFDWVA